ncbi:MAG: TIGR04255 family protein [Lachnospiraceae bacterium]|nr:TIGR04255 family protein [Lachnospiraceae bacterium]
MTSIARTDFQFNFLKNIIVRIDFQGVLEAEMEKILMLVKPYLKSKGFSRYMQRMSNEIEINVSNLNNPQTPAFSKVQSQEVHSFVNDDKGYVLDISSSFVCLNISSTAYAPFEDYSVLVLDIADIYKNNIDFVSISRIGIRKINVCMIEDKKKIKEYFSPAYFGYFEAVEGVDTFSSNRRDTFGIEQYKGNISCNIDQGNANGKILYKVSLDIDIYIDDMNTILQCLDFKQMNEILFGIYVDSLTDRFRMDLLGDDETVFSDIIGIEKNE